MKQRFLSPAFMVVFLAFMQMFVPLSIDLYLPALPEMTADFDASKALVNLTLAGFFLVFALSIIFFGPFADRYGRKPVLLVGAVVYTLGSLGCALSGAIYVLIVFRLTQAMGAGAIITISTVLIKDCFSGEMFQRILAVTQSLAVIAPMCAPVLGGFLLTFTNWRGAFVVLTLLGFLTLAVSLFLTETLERESQLAGDSLSAFRSFVRFLHHGDFMCILVLFSLLAAPYMAYLSVSSFIYIETFALSPQRYSLFYAVNSAAAIAGPLIYLHLTRSIARRPMTRLFFLLSAGAAGLLWLIGGWGPVCFLLAFLLFTIAEAMVRPFVMEVLLARVEKGETGVASSLINFMPTLLGSLGMVTGTLPWPDFIFGLGMLLALATAGAALLYRSVREL